MPPRADRKKAKGKKTKKRKHRQDSPAEDDGMAGPSEADDSSQRAPKRHKEDPPPPHAPGSDLHRALGYHPCSSSTTTTIGTSHYAGAHSFSIRTQNNSTTNLGLPKTIFEHLNPHVIHGAAHDSKDRRDAPACHEETRVAIRGDVVSWIKCDEGDDKPKKLMWLSGPAGAGKSAIAGSVAEACKSEGLLAASCFFSSFSPSKDRHRSCGLIATLVHHISQHRALHAFRRRLLSALEERPDIFHKRLKEQAERLILEPFREIHKEGEGQVGWPKVVIVDGIDEVVAQCDREEDIRAKSEEDQVEVLEVLFMLVHNPHFPFRIFVTSRPEKNITDFFDDSTVHRFTVSLFLDSKYNPNADIERFLRSKFAQIRRRSRISDDSWPGQGAVDRIVDMSSGQFIVPTTVIRWIEAGLPQRRLDEVLKLQRNTICFKNPFESLDRLYHHILARAPNPEDSPSLVIEWIHSIDSASTSRGTSTLFWRQFLEDEQGELNYRMAPISSLISIPSPNDDKSPITFYHKSLLDYLSNQTRCGDLYVSRKEVDMFISRRIVMVLKNKGPRVPPPPPQRLDGFLCSFWDLLLVASTNPLRRTSPPVIDRHATFLNHLGSKELATLASCDVSWRGRLFTLKQDTCVALLKFLHGIYFAIHKASKCNALLGSEGVPVQQTGQEGRKLECHPACVHWRTGIIAEMNRLGWCTHRLEAIPLGKLQDVTVDEADDILSGDAYKTCQVCTPMGGVSASSWGNIELDEPLGIYYDKRLRRYIPRNGGRW